jgi:hypothetical protein
MSFSMWKMLCDIQKNRNHRRFVAWASPSPPQNCENPEHCCLYDIAGMLESQATTRPATAARHNEKNDICRIAVPGLRDRMR